MARFQDLPIRRKVIVSGIAGTGTALLITGLIFFVSTVASARDSVRAELQVQASILASNTAASVAFFDPASALETLGALRATRYVDLACLYRDSNELFAEYKANGVTIACPAVAPSVEAAKRFDPDVLSAVTAGNRRHGTLYLRGNFNQVYARLRAQSVAAIAGTLLAVVASWLLSRGMSDLISGPILELSSTADRISAGDYSIRAARRGEDEIGQLVDAFNAMVGEVGRRDLQLREAGRLKDEFLAAVSHELRTPLNALVGWTNVLRMASSDPALMARALAAIERNAFAQARLIDDLLDISRIVTGKLHLRSERVDLVVVVDAALEVARPSAEAKKQTITRDVPSVPCWVIGDADRLQQIAWNLLSNAVKFTDAGGQVALKLVQQGEDFRLTVSDTGIGLSPEFLPHVFERFRQADGSLSRSHGGLGLGLAIARELVELHGGRITASSPGLNQGALFSVSVPRADRTHLLTVPIPQLPVGRLDGISVLVIDDDDDAVQVLNYHLTQAGAAARLATSAGEGLALFEAKRPDVLLCDLAMPVVNGHELIRTLRDLERSDGTARVPAIAISAHASSTMGREAELSGFDRFIPKPINIGHVFSAIRSLVGRSREAPPRVDVT